MESPYTKKKVPYQEEYNHNLNSRWYVLYCCSCNRICHENCKGPNEGLHSDECSCNAIGIFSCKCSN